MRWDGGTLTARQSELVAAWCGEPELIEDLSWGLTDTTVLRIRSRGKDLIVKAGGPDNHHLGREIMAHTSFTGPLVESGRAATMLHASINEALLVAGYLPGVLVEGTPDEQNPETYLQAGRLLKAFHSQARTADSGWETRATAKALAWLDTYHRIDPRVESRARQCLADYRAAAAEMVPTHGDWQPRNWISNNGAISVIDFGRFDLRPAATDLCRLAVQQWQRDPALEAAFLRGYGADPRDGDAWPVYLLREAIGTAVWAHQVGDGAFETQGHRMLDQALSRF